MAHRVHESADVPDDVLIGEGTSISHLRKIREGASLGMTWVVGRGAHIASGAWLGDNCKVQNYAPVYEPAQLADGVLIGPTVVLTIDTYPRLVNSDGPPKSAHNCEAIGVTIGEGVAIGARSVYVAPVSIGGWALVAAGSMVTRDVPAQALVAGVPARQIGWVGRDGQRFVQSGPSRWLCEATGGRLLESVSEGSGQ